MNKTAWLLAASLVLSTTGCVRMIMPTSIEQLEQRAFEGKRETVIDVNYVEAYRNLKRYYDKCINDRHSYNNPSWVKSELNREADTASFTSTLPYNTYVFQMNLTAQGENQTQVRFIRAKPKVSIAPPSKTRQASALEADFKFIHKMSRLKPEDWKHCSDIDY